MNSRFDRQATRTAEGGFTLVELLVCVALLALLTAVFVPALSGARARVRLGSAAEEMALALRATRDLALAQRRPESFAVDTARHVYRSGGAAPHALDNAVGVAFVGGDAGGESGAIRFFADGSSSGGVLRLSLKERRLDVVVDWLTGRVSVAQPGG